MLFILKPINPWGKYDVMNAIVVGSPAEDGARALASQYAGNEKKPHRDPWLDPELTSCRELTEGTIGVVLACYTTG